MPVQSLTKAAVTVAEMARMVGLSRSRFYQLMEAGAFPSPVYDVRTKRPIFVEALQEVCLEVRRRNCGIDGRPVLFYARRPTPLPVRHQSPKRQNETTKGDIAGLLEGLIALGLTTATGAEVEQVIKQGFPQGTSGIDQGEVLRAVFLHLKQRQEFGK